MTCGSKVRRSLLYVFLIDEESSTDAGKNITQNITELSCSSGANCLNIGSPNRAKMGTGLKFFRCPERLQATEPDGRGYALDVIVILLG